MAYAVGRLFRVGLDDSRHHTGRVGRHRTTVRRNHHRNSKTLPSNSCCR